MENKPFSLARMQEIQAELQAKYLDYWGGLSPEKAVSQLLWMVGEVGEVAEIIKKEGEDEIMTNPETRRHFVEEVCDTLMYLNDVLLCFGISPEEVERVYEEKHARNMKRW